MAKKLSDILKKTAHSKGDENFIKGHQSGRNAVSYKNDKPTENDKQFSTDLVSVQDTDSAHKGSDESTYDSVNEGLGEGPLLPTKKELKMGLRVAAKQWKAAGKQLKGMIKGAVYKEETEQLDELSKRFLGAYIKQAKNNLTRRSTDETDKLVYGDPNSGMSRTKSAAHERKQYSSIRNPKRDKEIASWNKRDASIDLAVNKISNTKPTKGSGRVRAKNNNVLWPGNKARVLAKEETELDERDGTSHGHGLRPRNFKAMLNVDLEAMAKKHGGKKIKSRDDAIKYLHTLPIEYQMGLDKNKFRFYNEESEQLDELSKETLSNYIRQRVDDIGRSDRSYEMRDGIKKAAVRLSGKYGAWKKDKKTKVTGWNYHKYDLKEELGHGARELTLFADNDANLHRQSHEPIMKNLALKHKKGKYDHEKAKKLWGYHADRAAQAYHKQFGSKDQPWHKMFSTADRREAAAHWADHNRPDQNNEEVIKVLAREEANLEEGHQMFRANTFGTNDETKNDGKKYKIIRFHRNGGHKTITKGVSLSYAQSHCSHPETSSSTCAGKNAKAYTRRHGEWFDGYDKQ